jgi:hypothetical protein
MGNADKARSVHGRTLQAVHGAIDGLSTASLRPQRPPRRPQPGMPANLTAPHGCAATNTA